MHLYVSTSYVSIKQKTLVYLWTIKNVHAHGKLIF